MERETLSRLGLAGSVALASVACVVAIVAASPATGGPAGLRPDLVTLPPAGDELRVTRKGRRVLLRFTNEVGNRGTGPLEVFPSPASPNCDGDGEAENDREASQRLFADSNANGTYERQADAVESERVVGCMRFHPAHDHWHVLDFARYELRREPTGRRVAGSRKVGFCLVDNRRAFTGPGSAPMPAYPFGSQTPNVGCDAHATQGLMPGWADIYTYALPGQQLAITGLGRGRYCLLSRADPSDLLDELNEANNERRTRIMLRPRAGLVRKLGGRCRI